MEQVQGGGRAGDLGGVDVRIDPDGGLFVVRPGPGVRHRGEQDVAALVRLADDFDGHQVGPCRRERADGGDQLVVRVEAVEAQEWRG
jgi:hypothetical protein